MNIPEIEWLTNEEEDKRHMEEINAMNEKFIQSFIDRVYEELFKGQDQSEPYQAMNKTVIRLEFERFLLPPTLQEAMRQYMIYKNVAFTDNVQGQDGFDQQLDPFFEDVYQHVYGQQNLDESTARAMRYLLRKEFESFATPYNNPEQAMKDFINSRLKDKRK